MKQAELQPFREMLRAQALEPQAKRSLFGPRVAAALVRMDDAPAPMPRAAPAMRPMASLFGRRRPQPAPTEPDETLLLAEVAEVEPSPRLRLSVPAAGGHFSETPFHAEDLADPAPVGPIPGVIAGWSAVKPPSAQVRLLRRLHAVVSAECEGLSARLAAAGVEAA